MLSRCEPAIRQGCIIATGRVQTRGGQPQAFGYQLLRVSGNVNAVFVHQSEAEFVGGAGASWQHMLSELPRSVFHVGPFTCRALCQCVSKSQCIANIRLVDMMILTMKSAVMNASQRTRPFAPETLLVPGQVCVCVCEGDRGRARTWCLAFESNPRSAEARETWSASGLSSVDFEHADTSWRLFGSILLGCNMSGRLTSAIRGHY